MVKRKWIIILMLVAVVLIAVVISSLRHKGVPVSFSQPQIGNVKSPIVIGPGDVKVTFYATNSLSRPILLQVKAIEMNAGNGWMADTQFQPANVVMQFGEVKAEKASQVWFVLPHEPWRTRLRVTVCTEATTAQKVHFAFARCWANLCGKEHYKQFWFQQLAVPSYETVTPEIQ